MNVRQFLTIIRMTILEGLRSRALLGMLFFVVMACAVSLLVVTMFAFEESKVLLDFGFSFMQLAALTIIFFLAISMVTRDIQQRSACMILSGPVPRSTYITGRFCGLLIVLFFTMISVLAILAGLGLFILVRFTPATLPENFSFYIFPGVFFLSYVSHALLLAIAFFFSVVTTNVYLSMLATCGFYIIGQTLEPIIKILLERDFVQINPLYTSLLQVVSWIVPNFRAFDFKTFLFYGQPPPPGLMLLTGCYGLIYIGLIMQASKLLFSTKDI